MLVLDVAGLLWLLLCVTNVLPKFKAIFDDLLLLGSAIRVSPLI
jgi:hypothetical protein